jgi:hypothetical protein
MVQIREGRKRTIESKESLLSLFPAAQISSRERESSQQPPRMRQFSLSSLCLIEAFHGGAFHTTDLLCQVSIRKSVFRKPSTALNTRRKFSARRKKRRKICWRKKVYWDEKFFFVWNFNWIRESFAEH